MLISQEALPEKGRKYFLIKAKMPVNTWWGIKMRRAVVCELIRCLQEKYGDAYAPWGTDRDEIEGTGFVIAGLPVFFSAMSFGEIPADKIDVQVDSSVKIPEELGYDQYMLHGLYSVQELVALVEEFRKPVGQWPCGT